MEPLLHLGRTLASIRSIGGLSLEEAAVEAGVTVSALRDAEQGVLAPGVADALAGFYGLDAEALAGGQVITATGAETSAKVFLFHGPHQDFDPADWGMLNRALQFGRLYATRASRNGLIDRHSFIPVPPAGPLPRDAAKQGHRLARLVRSRLQLGGAPLGDLRVLIEERLGIVVLVEPFETLNLRAASIIDAARTGAAIVLSEDDNVRRRTPALNRVYLAHELSHLLFDPGEPGRVQIALDDNPQGYSKGSLLESRARGFAAELLLPKDGVERLLGMPRGEEASMAQARGLVKQAVEHFGTSWQISVWHLKNLGFMGDRVANELAQEWRRGAATDTTTLPEPRSCPRGLAVADAAVIPAMPTESLPDFVREARRIGSELATAWVDAILAEAYTAAAEERPLEATDLLFERLDALFSGKDDMRARLLLNRLDPARLAPEVLTALLPLASHGRNMLGETWTQFCARSLQVLETHWHFSAERRQRLLARLG
ncbi:ImmA/IrrE family metallo-endopeptidase [Corallococcus exiguus]|uniref:ImmA/IrrE family metallo-endopeptidase n=1 Tax=Corallococcus exiguus TaxID=83462 RepID=UPI001471A11E|nr:XRE family transcriptional regulator [Corallococcus exiguus]NNB89469.1 ImmA/IrrE family metallo-endopeptidase [Corallococcus exiguus]